MLNSISIILLSIAVIVTNIKFKNLEMRLDKLETRFYQKHYNISAETSV